MTAPPFTPAPSHLSPEARAVVEQPVVQRPVPLLHDREGWTELVRRTDSALAARLSSSSPVPVSSERREIDGIPVHVLTRAGTPHDAPVYLDVHGGALIFGGGNLVGLVGTAAAYTTGLVHWAVDYRMPPEHPFPAALDDLVTVYRNLLGLRDPSQIVVGGRSAGGNLAAALLLRIKAAELAMPAGLVLMSPEVDLTESGDSFTTLAPVSVGLQSLRQINMLYANGYDIADPLISPLFGDLRGFPPTLLISGTRDLFLSNTVRMHRALRESGVDADLHVIDARPHGGFGAAPEEVAIDVEHRLFARTRVGLEP